MAVVPADAQRALRLALDAVARRDDVAGVGLGPRRDPVTGTHLGRPAIQIVTTEPDRGRRRADRAELPSSIGGLPVERSTGARRPRPLAIPADIPGEKWYGSKTDLDRRQRRELIGGIAVGSSDTTGSGSLGFFLTSDPPPGAGAPKAYGTGCMHVLAPSNFTRVQAPHYPIQVFHPESNVNWWGVKPDTEIGDVVATSAGWGYVAPGVEENYRRDVDLAVFELRSGQKWIPAVDELGGITGVATDLTFERICLGAPYPVATKGALGEGPTGGHIHCMSFYWTHDTGLPAPPDEPKRVRRDLITYGNQLIVRSNPLPDGSWGNFAQPGDSGSAVLNTNNELVGAVRAGYGLNIEYEADATWDIDGNAPDLGDAFVDPIHDLLAAIHDPPGPLMDLNLQVALAESPDIADITARVQP